ncbi:MAG: phospholipase D-like domain-containing protein [Pseudomonadota bacterium]
MQSLPDGLSHEGKAYQAGKVEFLRDLTYVDAEGQRHSDQQIFDRWFSAIEQARKYILIDVFLYNDFQGPVRETTRSLAREMTNTLVKKKKDHPEMRIVVITDPVNTVYGGVRSTHFAELREAGVEVYVTDLTKLRDSNPGWSSFWRLFVRPFGNSNKGWLPSPFDHGPVTLRSYLSFLNFKANHRKVLIADRGRDVIAIVTSGNIHDASSAHSNVALSLNGPAAADLMRTENAILAFSNAEPMPVPEVAATNSSGVSVQVLTEGKVNRALLAGIDGLKRGDRLDMAMFFLSDRKVIAALKRADKRGVAIRLLLDPNKTAFGVNRGGIPNVPVAAELKPTGMSIRWCAASGEQCHSKIIIAQKSDGSAWMSIGSTNLTRRNLRDYNLETNLMVRGPVNEPIFVDALRWFNRMWSNDGNNRFSTDYAEHSSGSLLKKAVYLFAENSGWATF